MSQFMTSKEIAAMFGVHRTRIIRWCKAGWFVKPHLVCGRHFLDRAEVLNFIARGEWPA